MKNCDVVIIGAGIVGLSITDWLLSKNINAYCLEKAAPGTGQSAGRVRIFRYLHQDSSQIVLAKEARAGWHAWETRFNTKLLTETGRLSFGHNLEPKLNRVNSVHAAAQLLPYNQWQQLTKSHSLIKAKALYEHNAGSLRADVAINTLATVRREHVIKAEAYTVQNQGSGVVVESSMGQWQASKAIIAAGAATAGLAQSAGIPIAIETRLHCRLTFATNTAHFIPVISDSSGIYDEAMYGAPIDDGSYVLGLSRKQDNLEPAQLASLPNVRERIIRYAAAALPSLTSTVTDERLCTATYLSGRNDDAFGLFSNGNVHAFAGNNVFKFAPVIGNFISAAMLRDTS